VLCLFRMMFGNGAVLPFLPIQWGVWPMALMLCQGLKEVYPPLCLQLAIV
jgi:hypothetical protein